MTTIDLQVAEDGFLWLLVGVSVRCRVQSTDACKLSGSRFGVQGFSVEGIGCGYWLLGIGLRV